MKPTGTARIGRFRTALQTLSVANENFTVGAAISFLTVAMYEGRALREYAELLELPQSTMSRHLLDLGEINRKREPGMLLIEQKPDIMDRRKNIYTLTPKGRALIADLTRALEARLT